MNPASAMLICEKNSPLDVFEIFGILNLEQHIA